MCGRFTLAVPPEQVARRFGLAVVPVGLVPRYNIAPSQDVAVVANRADRRLEMFHWGLIPSWAKDPSVGNRMINARAESLSGKPSFRAAFKRRRCLVPADGFYEWKQEGKVKVPMYARLKSRRPFAFAGLWEEWTPPEGEVVRSCTIITTASNELLEPVHDRMPVILPPDQYEAWLEPGPADTERLGALLVPFDAEPMEAYEVSPLVNNPRNERAECVRRTPG